jgi:hypothetical protein
MDVILVMPSKEDRKANRDTPKQWAYEVIVVETAKDMVKKLSAKRPAGVFLDAEMISKLRKQDLQTVAKEYSVAVLPREEHHRIVQEVQAGILGGKARLHKVMKRKLPPYTVKKVVKAANHRLGAARRNVDFSPSIFAKQQDSNARKPRTVDLLLPELYDPANGRIDAKRIADRLAIPLSKLSDGLGVDYRTVYKTPSSERLQPALRPIKRSLEILSQTIDNQETVLAWLNTPHPLLDKKTPLSIILGGQADQLETILENAIAGIPY